MPNTFRKDDVNHIQMPSDMRKRAREQKQTSIEFNEPNGNLHFDSNRYPNPRQEDHLERTTLLCPHKPHTVSTRLIDRGPQCNKHSDLSENKHLTPL
ncbi:hypothetical protein F2P81_023324 [Scophthalmus maximus]|uniref:Uncharacterized protein n=1 Tax=Scophthalmus maximus TaxID=52904 RepID=A0A6A4RZB7_SCOMX|nr:hypothetical protein F2P81_023324 [Scophthalmus maximus]